MTVEIAALAAGALAVVTFECVRRAFRRTASINATYRRMYGVPQQRTITVAETASSRWTKTLGQWSAAIVDAGWLSGVEERRRYALRVTSRSIVTVVASALSVMVWSFVIAAVLVAVLWPRLGLPTFAAPITVIVVAIAAGWYRFAEIISAAERQHRQFRSAATAYVSLVSVCMTTQRTAAESIAYAAQVGEGQAFETIHGAVTAAPQMGIAVWEAVEAVGVEYGCRELEDLASSVAHVSGVGVGADSTVRSIATRMRQVALDDMQTVADRQTAAMQGPTMLFVVGAILFLAYPLVLRILDALAGNTTGL